MPANAQPLLQVNKLTVFRGYHRLFHDLSLVAHGGEILHIRGLNGSGKTTLLRCLAGLTRADEGSISWFGESPRLRPSAEARAAMTLVGHRDGLKAGLTPLENLRTADGLRADEPHLAAEEALQRAGLGERLHVPTGQLSAGQRRRAALARLLTRNTLVWLLDEPFTSLDTDGVAMMTGWLNEQRRNGGLMIMTSHQPLAESLGAREIWVGAR